MKKEHNKKKIRSLRSLGLPKSGSPLFRSLEALMSEAKSMETKELEGDLFFTDIESLELAYKKFSENLRIQYLVSNWEAQLIRWLIGSFRSLHTSTQKQGIIKYLSILISGARFISLSTYIALFHSRAQDVQSFYMSYHSKISGLDDATYSKNKKCKVITIYGNPESCST